MSLLKLFHKVPYSLYPWIFWFYHNIILFIFYNEYLLFWWISVFSLILLEKTQGIILEIFVALLVFGCLPKIKKSTTI